ncbi:hypothetical protein GCM10023169_16590 [Georgenia halophila]|uniref:Secreted protein n=1 Tax=Georgenia halophila TaxID=620889 RepID=A0ABP8L609_9MICO
MVTAVMVRSVSLTFLVLCGVSMILVADNTTSRVLGVVLAIVSSIGATASWWDWAHREKKDP